MNSPDRTARPALALSRRRVLHCAGVLAVGALPGRFVSAQARWPDRPLRFIVPFPPGIVVDNRPGGTTQVGTEAAARAEPDGSTMLLVTATTFTVLPNLRKMSFDLNSFEIAGGVADYVPIVTARNGLGVKSLPELIALAKRQPGKLTWGSAGVASAGHIYGEILKRHAGIDMLHVPFKGSGELVAANRGVTA